MAAHFSGDLASPALVMPGCRGRHGRQGRKAHPRLAGRFPDLAQRSGSRSGAIRAVSPPGPAGARSVAACVASVFLLLQAPGCVQQRCYEELDCQPPAVCGFTGVCVWQCSTAADCGPGFACLANLCTPTATGAVSCSDDMVPVASAYCVDRYEASRPDATSTSAGRDDSRAVSVAGVLPWQVASNAAAEAACRAAGKRLCTPDEWLLACRGPDGTVYAYGDRYDTTACNGIDAFGWGRFHLAPTGEFERCTNEWGVLDINGNLWEHTAGGSSVTIRGGAYNCGDSALLHRCDYVPTTWTPSARGLLQGRERPMTAGSRRRTPIGPGEGDGSHLVRDDGSVR